MEASRLRTLMMKSRLLPQALCILSLLLVLGASAYAAPPPSCSGMTLGNNADLNGFLPFSGDPTNIWNQNIASAPVDPNSAAIIAGLPISNHLHPDFGPNNGIPYVVVDSNTQPFVNMNGPAAGPPGPEASQSDDVVEPAPPTAEIEGSQPDCLDWPAGANYFGDTHMLVVDRNQCWDYETYLTSRCDGVYSVTGQSIWDLQYGEQRPWGWSSTDAAGDSVFVGLMKYDEANNGTINHAVRFTVENTKGDGDGGYFVLPDTHAAAYGSKYKYLNVMGMRLRLKNDEATDAKIATYSTINQNIFTALQNYGMILADNGGNLFISGAPDPRWDVNDLGNWHGGPEPIEATDFEVVQMNVGVGTPDLNVGDDGAYSPAISTSYMDANSAPYTVNDVEVGDYPGGLGPEGTSLTGGGKYPVTGPSGVTPGPPPVINTFYANQFIIFPACGHTITAGTPVTFFFNIHSSVPVITGMGNFYSYIDNAGPVRVDHSGNGTLTITPRLTQTYTLYSMNADGMTESSSCTITVNGSMLPVPVLSPITGTYTTITNVQITEPGYPDATIYYTTDQSLPTYPVSGTEQLYSGPFQIADADTFVCNDENNYCNYTTGEVVNAIAVVPSFSSPSPIGSATYNVSDYAATPVISPASGSYTTDNAPLTVTITDSTIPIDVNQDGDSVIIYYTTDGTPPGGDAYGDATGTSQVCYGSPCTFTVTGMVTVNAVADAVGYTQSGEASATYTDTIDYFTVSVNPLTMTINPGHDGVTGAVTVTSLGGYSGTVNLTCSGFPNGDSCTFNPSTVTVTPTAPGISSVTISVGTNAAKNHNPFPLFPGGATLAVALCFFGLRKRRRLQMVLLLAVSVIGLSLFTGCGTTGFVPTNVAVTVTGTDASTGWTTTGTFQLAQLVSQ